MPVVTDPEDEVRAVLLRYEKGEIGPPGADHEIMVILRRQGHITVKQIRPMLVGIHRQNRGSQIGSSRGVPDLMGKIAELNWNNDMCSHAICVELAPGDRTDENEFRRWCEDACLDFPEVEPGSLKFVSLACSHTNCGLRLIVCRCASSNEKLGDGRYYSIDVIRKHDKAYALAAEEGLTWTVVPAVVLEWYPELVQLWSISRNTAGHVQQPVSEITGMNLLYTLWTKALAANRKPDYTTIVMNVTRGQPWWADMIEEFIAFLAKHAGGTEPSLAKMWTDFLAFHAHKISCEDRQMPAYVWQHLAMISEARLAYAIAKAVYTCPEVGIEYKRCKWMTESDMRALVKKDNKDQRASAEKFLVSAAALFEDGKAMHSRAVNMAAASPSTKGFETLAKARRTTGAMCTDIYVQIAIMVGRFATNKPQDEDFGKDKCEHLGDIEARARRIVAEVFPSLADADCLDCFVVPRRMMPLALAKVASVGPPPAAAKKKATAGASAGCAPEMPTMSTIDGDGRRVGAMDRLNEAGLEIGSNVVHATIKGVYEIEEVDLAGGLAKVTLKLVYQCITMAQLWAMQPRPDADPGTNSDETVENKAEEVRAGADGTELQLGPTPEIHILACKSKAKPPEPPQPAVTPAQEAAPQPASDPQQGGASAESSSKVPAELEELRPVDFEPQKVVDLELFLGEWKLLLMPRIQEHSFNPEWPESRLTANEKYLRIVAQGMVFAAVGLLGCKVDKDVSASRVLKQLAKPSVGFYVSTGHRGQGTNRER